MLAGIATAVSAPADVRPQARTYSVVTVEHGDVRHYYVPGRVAAGRGEIHGVVFNDAGGDFTANLKDLPRMAEDGINTVEVVVTEYQNGRRGSRVFDGKATPTARQLTGVVRAARRAGLAVEVMPVILSNGSFVARKFYQPRQIHRWFTSYRSMIDRWARVAQHAGANIFCVGSEYDAIANRVWEWQKTIRSVDRRFHRSLTYMATAGNFPYVRFWRSLDIVSLSPYYTLSKQKVPTVRELVRKWRRILRGEYGEYQRLRKPLLWNELGYQSQVRTAYEPYALRHQRPSEQAQANAYQAAIDVTAGRGWLRGIVFYRWDRPINGAVDSSWTPVEKKAECVMAKSWAPSTGPKVNGQPPACTQLSSRIG